MDDLLGAALKTNLKNSISNSSTSEKRRKKAHRDAAASPTPPSSEASHQPHHSGTFKTKKRNTKRIKCHFCNDNQAVVIIKKSLTSKAYCLFHYYTSKACRIATNKVKLIEKDEKDEEFHTQLPYVQELFAEAFTDLQKEISVESTRSFQSMAAKGDDPLSILIDNGPFSRESKFRNTKKKASRKNNADNGDSNEGGFMRQVQAKEISLMEEQSRRIDQAARESLEKVTQQSNPYKRRKTSSKSSWHFVLNKEPKTNSIEDNRMNKMHSNLLSNVVEGVTCSCGSQEVELCGNVKSLNNDVSKAETWGFKRDVEVSSRFRCLNCNKTWNEEG